MDFYNDEFDPEYLEMRRQQDEEAAKNQAEEITLSEDQEKAKEMFLNFILNPAEQVMVLQGYAGTGKSTLVKDLLENMPKYLKMARAINPSSYDYGVQLTATTNKAAEALAQITGESVKTIHNFLGLRVQKDPRTGKSELVPRVFEPQSGYVLIIDEASMIDSNLLQLIFNQTENCKIMFIGDPAQLPPVGYNFTPVFNAGFTTAKLEKVMRQAAGNPIITLATQFRETVSTKVWKSFKPDGQHVIHLDQSDFEDAIIAEFTRPDWRYTQSKILAWTNDCAIRYNHAVSNQVTGESSFQVGDYVVCNKHTQVGKLSIKTDQLVYVTSIGEDVEYQGVMGNWVTLDYQHKCFLPKTLEAKNNALKRARANDNIRLAREIDDQWIDLRAAYAQTLNKSQGSTYDRVFIDLDDLRRCNIGDLIARLLYVGVSRARYQVFLKGDFA